MLTSCLAFTLLAAPIAKKPKKDGASPSAAEPTTEDKGERHSVERAVVVDSSEYEPAGTKYHPIHDACWERGQK